MAYYIDRSIFTFWVEMPKLTRYQHFIQLLTLSGWLFILYKGWYIFQCTWYIQRQAKDPKSIYYQVYNSINFPKVKVISNFFKLIDFSLISATCHHNLSVRTVYAFDFKLLKSVNTILKHVQFWWCWGKYFRKSE